MHTPNIVLFFREIDSDSDAVQRQALYMACGGDAEQRQALYCTWLVEAMQYSARRCTWPVEAALYSTRRCTLPAQPWNMKTCCNELIIQRTRYVVVHEKR